MKEYKHIEYSDVCPKYNYLDLLLPDGECKAVFVYIHGGGLLVRKPGDHVLPFMKDLCEAGIGIATIEYRGFPRYKYPDFIEDSAAAVAWVKEHIKEYVDCDKIFVGGSSAGGYLSMMLCFDKKYLDIYNIAPTDLAGFIHDAGQPTAHFNVLKSKGVDSRRVIIDETSPLYHIGVDKEYPPMVFIVSDGDMENRYEQTMLVMSTMKHFRYDESKYYCEVKHGGHCHYVGTDDGVFSTTILKFIEKYI